MDYEDEAMSDDPSRHIRNDEYSYNVPTPPRILVPPAAKIADVPDLSIGHILSPVGGTPNMDFLNTVDYSGTVTGMPMLDWKYERRREAQMILPFLYLGPMVAAKDRDFLKEHGISMIMGIRQRAPAFSGAFKIAEELGIVATAIDVPNNQALIAAFQQASQRINEHLAAVYEASVCNVDGPNLGKVLVFCESGNERSAAVVAAYLIEMLQGYDYIKAIQLCQVQRFCINFGEESKQLLQVYCDILNARRSVAQSVSTPAFPGDQPALCDVNVSDSSLSLYSKPKRPRSNSYGADMSLDGAAATDYTDNLRFDGRDFAPFEDSVLT